MVRDVDRSSIDEILQTARQSSVAEALGLSATQSQSTSTSKYHIPIDGKLILGHEFFASDVDCWALGEQVQQVSKLRLRPFHADPSMKLVMPSELVTKIQRAVVKAMNAGSLLVADGEVTSPAGATKASTPSKAPTSAIGAAMFAAKTKQAAVQPPAPPDSKEAA
jgi:uncharacterized protein YifN (PemK superfamily)